MAGENPASTTEYIQHHLQNLVYGYHPEQGWGFAKGANTSETAQIASEMGFMAIHVDSLAWSIGLGLIFCWLFRAAAKRATTGVPSGFLNFVELILEFIDGSVKDSFHGVNKMVAPLALTCLLYTSPSPRDRSLSRMPSSA